MHVLKQKERKIVIFWKTKIQRDFKNKIGNTLLNLPPNQKKMYDQEHSCHYTLLIIKFFLTSWLEPATGQVLGRIHLDQSAAFLTSDDFVRSNEIVETKWPIY